MVDRQLQWLVVVMYKSTYSLSCKCTYSSSSKCFEVVAKCLKLNLMMTVKGLVFKFVAC